MKMTRTLMRGLVAFTLITTAPALPALAAMPALDSSSGMPTLAPLLETVTPAVVNVSVMSKAPAEENPLYRDPFFRYFFNLPEQPQAKPRMSAGSGVIIDAAKGHVMTNHHVVDNADEITVTLKDRRSFKAKLIGSDPGTDIALLEIEPDNLTDLPIGDSGSMRVGDFVVAIGNPFGIGQTVTSGIVSALGRSGLNIEGYEDFIQTDASINPGNSGGALINLKGELIGINTAIIGPGGGNVGIGFAVPSDMATAVMDQLLKFGEVRRGRLGVSIQELTPEIAEAFGIEETKGAIVTQVEPDSPAKQAGIAAGDVIVSLDGEPVRGVSDLRNRIGLVPVGETLDIELYREGKKLTVAARIEKTSAKEESGPGMGPKLAGATFADIEPDRPVGGAKEGVAVMRVEPGSPAWQAGLRTGDVVLAVSRKPVANTDQFKAAVEAANKVLALTVLRGGNKLFLIIQ